MPKCKQKDKQQNVIKEIYLRSDIQPYTKRTTLETKLQQMDAKNIFNANEASIARKEDVYQTLSTIEQINNNIDDEERMKALERNIDNYVKSNQPKQFQPHQLKQQIIQKKSISEDSSKFLISISKVAKIGESADSLPSKLSGFSNKKKIEVKKSTKRSFKDKYNNNQKIDRKRRRVNNKTIFIKTPEDSKQSGCCCF